MTQFLIDGEQIVSPVFLFAHGAGVGMDSEFMTAIARGLAEKNIGVARFEFNYMAARRAGGSKRPPPQVHKLEAEFHDAIASLNAKGPLFIGGKSMGGRIASMIADQLLAEKKINGAICLGYPFHPPGKPDQLRTEHLKTLRSPTLICQGTRDPFGTANEAKQYELSQAVEFAWIEDGDHSFKPRKASGRTLEQNLSYAIESAADFVGRHA